MPRSPGFTLTELVVIIVVVAVLAAIAVPRWIGKSGFEDRGLRDETAAALRYVQKSAIAARRLVCVDFTANGLTATVATSFAATDCSGGAALARPGGGTLSIAGTGGATYSAQPGATLTFSPLGRPSLGTTIAVQNLPPALDITVEPETGYVH